MTSPSHSSWHFFRAGGFDQVRIATPADLAGLRQLDQKLWASLACPTASLELDPKMLAYIDHNNDGRIRAPELLDTVDWVLARLKNADVLFDNAALPLDALSDTGEGQRLERTARHLLQLQGKADQRSIDLNDSAELSTLFPPSAANGDGIVPVALAGDDAALSAAITDVLSTLAEPATDRSGEPGLNAQQIVDFFAQAQQLLQWHQAADQEGLRPFGDNTAEAITAIEAVRAKVDDYFNRVAMSAFDPRATALMNGQEEELIRLAALPLTDPATVAHLPLAVVQHGDALPLTAGINPAFTQTMAALREQVITPLFGPLEHLTLAQWQTLLTQCDAYTTWSASQPNLTVRAVLTEERILELARSDIPQRLHALIATDLAVADEADGLVELDKLLRLQQGLVKLLRNFVSFQDFYTRSEKAVFQAGTLLIEGKSCDLVLEVANIDAHAAIATKSNSFLLYCACTRKGQPIKGKEAIHIVAAVTAGDEGDLMVGRNGLFYDRAGNDWDATVVKVVPNAISIAEAFWSPYRRVAGIVSEQIQKFAASRDTDMVNQTATKVGGAGAPAAGATTGFDIAKFAGIFAAFGLAVGALGTALAATITGILSLLWWQMPLVLVGVVLAISGPSMIIAWFKLRRRSLGPILDANGWAVNSQARISIGFGAMLTQLASLPQGSSRSLKDPHQPPSAWPWILLIALIALGIAGWQYGWWEWLLNPEAVSAAAPVTAPAEAPAPAAAP